MLGFIMAFVVGALVVGYLASQRRVARPGDPLGALRGKGKLVAAVAIGVLIVAALVQSVVIVQAGTVGVVKRLGAVQAELKPGIHIIFPGVDTVTLYPTIKKSYEATENPRESRSDFPDIIITALTSDGQQIRVGITARFMIQPGKAAWILQNLGTEEEYVEKIVKTEIRGSGRRVPTRFAAFDLYTKKSYEAQQALYDEIFPKFDKNGLILDELVLRNITFTPEYAKTLEEKQKIRKEQKIVSAEGDARSIEIRQTALTKNPTIIQWEFVQKLAPNIQWGILPQNMLPMFNLQALTGKQQ